MEDQYGMADLRQLVNGDRAYFSPAASQHIEVFPGYRNLLQPTGDEHQHHQYSLMMVPGGQVSDMMPDFRADSAAASAAAKVGSAPTLSGGFEVEGASYGGDGGCGRWPRQETLTLLEIRSRLDSKFKEANQKGPLWDEVARIMSVEYGYQRSGKKCREKFENLYKYYKKTKEGKAGRQDGKHYRFFRQLEALYGQTSNGVSVSETHLVSNASFKLQTAHGNQESTNQFPKHSDSLSLSNSSEFESSSSDEVRDFAVNGGMEDEGWERRKKRRGKKCWKAKIKGFINSQMRKLVEKQEEWLEKIMKSLEQKENERMMKEEEFRKDEISRIEREHRFWAKERAWIEARDNAFMEAMQKITGREVISCSSLIENQNEDGGEILNNNGGLKGDDTWRDCEITRLIQLRNGIESGFRETGEANVWEEIRAKMACAGYERGGLSCKEKWESINKYMKKNNAGKKRKDDSRGFDYFRNESGRYDQGGTTHGEIKEEENQETTRDQINQGSSLNPSTNANHVQDHCFRFLSGEGEFLWENYGTKANKGDQSQ